MASYDEARRVCIYIKDLNIEGVIGIGVRRLEIDSYGVIVIATTMPEGGRLPREGDVPVKWEVASPPLVSEKAV